MREEDNEKERLNIVKTLVRSKLQETGDIDRLRCYIRRRLAASGWKCDTMKELRAAVNENNVCDVTVQNLYDKIAIGRKVDERLMDEAFKKIKYSYKEALSENDNEEVDRVSDVMANDTKGNSRYINDCQN